VLVDDGTLTDLLTSSSSYVNQDLATFYGTTAGGSQGQTFVKTNLPHRSGILTTGGVMATQAHSTLPSLVLRGKLVRENLLCDAIPPPPPNIPAAATTVPEAGTTRDLLLSHQQKGTICPSCHQYMDSIGTGFGIFDATGAYQPNDANGFPGDHPAIDSSGSVAAMGAGDLQTTFTDSADLTKQLAGADRVRQCFALQELRYALGRVETSSDACSAQQIYAAFSPKFDIRQLLLAVVQSDAFRYRSAPPAGSACQ
jgi:hypothetical protein